MSAQMKLSVVIVSYNQFELLRRAIASVRQKELPFACEIIVVDNASAADVEEFLRPLFPEVAVIRNRENVGFGRANNQGAAIARGEYLLFLNSDAQLLDDALTLLVQKMDEDPSIGALGPLLLNEDGTFQLSYGRRISLFAEFYQKWFALHREKKKLGQPPSRDVLRDVDWLSGACLLLRRECFSDGPIFDERFFLYFEDHDLCLRLRALNKRVVFWSQPAVRHASGQSVALFSGTQLEYRRSQLYLYKKYGLRCQALFLRLFLLVKFSLKLLVLFWRNDETGRQQAATCRSVLKIIIAKQGA